MRKAPITSSELYELARKHLLYAARVPGRTDIYGAAVILGYSVEEVGFMVRAGIVHYLAKSVAGVNSRKFFSVTYLLQLSGDVAFHERASKCCYAAWRKKNSGKSTQAAEAA
jgi:hypothetical protein